MAVIMSCLNESINCSHDINEEISFINNDITENVALSAAEVFGPQYHRTARIIILIVMMIFSSVGNTLVCWRLIPLRSRRYPKSKILFLNLALADLFVTFIAMTSQLIWEVMGRRWIAGDAFCKIFKLLQTFSLASSTYMLVSIAADRHGAIVRPLSRCPTPKQLAVGAWLASLVPSVPCTIIFREVRVNIDAYYCASIFYTKEYPPYYRQIYMTFVFLTVFIIPFILLISLYTKILVTIWIQSSAFTSCQQSTSSLPRAKVKTLKMTVVIFLTFMVTNVPYVVQEIILAFGYTSLLDPSTVALFGVISASNSALNPYIFLAFQSNDTCCELTIKVLSFFICCKTWRELLLSRNTVLRTQGRHSITSGSAKTSTRIITNGANLQNNCMIVMHENMREKTVANKNQNETFL